MSRTITGTLLAALAAALVAPLATLAQECTPAERQHIARRQQQATAAMKHSKSAAQYVEMLTGPDPGVSPACRHEQIRFAPAIVRCTSEEKATILEGYEEALEAMGSQDAEGALAALDALQGIEDSVSEECWIAASFHQDARVQQACSDEDRLSLAQRADSALEALRQGLYGDPMPILQLAEQLSNELEPKCWNRLIEIGQEAHPGHVNSPTFGGMGAVEDHGGGLYVAPGLGACDPGGCTAF
jgi:hypothetical protein